MWRFDDDERVADPDGPEGPPGRPASGRRSWWVRTLRILLLAVVTAVPGVPAIFFLMPLPRGADGITLCFPVIGPLQQFAEGLAPDLDEIVHIHERVHASQCRRLGAVDYARTYLQDEGMIALEAEAFCAEARTLALRGQSTDRWVSRIVETLYLEYPHDESLTYADVTRIVGAWCPPSPPPRTAHP